MIVTQNNPKETTLRPDYIATNHWQEWVESGVKPSIIAANIYTELDARELDEVLNRNNRRKWKHSDKLVPAWIVRGIDPESGELSLLGVQAKPDNPDIKNGRNQKYLGANDYGSSPLFLKVDDYDYWLKIIRDLGIPIIITEGAKKAACLLSNGYAAISIPGVSTCRKKGRLHKLINKFCGFGRLFYLCFDNDVITKRPVQLALEGLARDLTATGSKVMVISLPEGDAKGVDDYIVANSPEAFKTLISHAQTIEEWKEDNDLSWAAKQEQIKNRKKSKLARAVETIQTAWGDFLRWNDLTQAPELGDEQLEIDDLRVKIALELDMDVTKDDSVTAIRTLAKGRRYHPIKEYLEDVAESYKDVDLSIIDNLSTELFGNDSEICNIYMKRFLIGSVARMMRPGTKMDNAIILHGAEGIKKSTFWNVLFGEDWFSDSIDDSNGKDEKMLIHEYWCLEWSEFATVYKHKDIEALKKFLAQKIDSFRKPFERAISKHKRGCVFVGTTNNPEILQDPAGRNRRFWIVNVNQEIDIAKLEKIRDQLWAAAYYCWKRGDIHYIPERSREANLQDKENEQFKATHPWHEIIESFLTGKHQTYLGELYDYLEIEKGRREARHQRQITECLKILGWEKTGARPFFKGERHWEWKKTKENKCNFDGLVDTKPQKTDSTSNASCPPDCPSVVHHLSMPTNNTAQPSVFDCPPEQGGQEKSKVVDTLESPSAKEHSHHCPPVHQKNKKSKEFKEEIIQPISCPPDCPPEQGGQEECKVVDTLESPSAKEHSHHCPPVHQKNKKSKEFKKEIIQPHPSFGENKQNYFRITGITDKWNVFFEVDRQHIHIKYASSLGAGDVREFIQLTERLTLKQFREKCEGAIWELERETVGDRVFRVKVWSREVTELEPKWIDGCKLVSVPSPPGKLMFIFADPNGRVIPIAGLDEFELME
ncbi:MAG: VapE domain-containing protein [Rivularia sp. (in: cyanobacteria)]